MSEFNKDDTFIFKPDKEEKLTVQRTGSDRYSSSRKVKYEEPEEEEHEKTSPLVYVAIALAVALIITIIVAVIILKSDGDKKEENIPQQSAGVENTEKTPGEDTREEEEVILNNYGLIFNTERVFLLENGGYGVDAELYDAKNTKVGTRKIRITDETDIRDNGIRIELDIFMKVLENQGGNLIKFDSQVREEDDTALLITYDSRGFLDEVPEELPEEEIIEETDPEKEGEEGFIDEPAEEIPAETSPEEIIG